MIPDMARLESQLLATPFLSFFFFFFYFPSYPCFGVPNAFSQVMHGMTEMEFYLFLVTLLCFLASLFSFSILPIELFRPR